MKSGQKLEGKIIEQTGQYIKFDSGTGGVMIYYVDEIDTVDGQKLQPPAKYHFSVVAKARYMLASDVKGQSGSIEMAKLSLRIGYQTTLNNQMPFYINIGPDHYLIEGDKNGIPAEAKSRGIRTGTEIPLPFIDDDRYSLGVELNPTYQTSDNIDFSNSGFRFNFSTFLKYKGDDDFVWVAGVNVRPRYVDLPVLPVVGFNYRFTDRLSANLVSDDPNISYQLTDRTKLLWDYDYTLDEFQVTGGAHKGTTLDIHDFATGLALQHYFTKHVYSSVGAGGVFARSLKLNNGQGKDILDDGVYFSLKLNVNF